MKERGQLIETLIEKYLWNSRIIQNRGNKTTARNHESKRMKSKAKRTFYIYKRNRIWKTIDCL